MNELRRLRLDIEDFDGITVVNFVDRKILDEQNTQVIADQLFGLVDVEGRKQIILSFRRVEYLSSGACGKLIMLHRKVQQANGQLIMCHIDQGILDLFEINKTVLMFTIVKTEQDALDAFGERALLTSCPVCATWSFSRPGLAFRAPCYDATWAQTCAACGATFTTTIGQIPGTEGIEGTVRRLVLPTSDKDRVVVTLEPPQAWGSFAPGGVYRLELAGRLDPLASEVLRRSWESLPTPRLGVFDLRPTKEVTRQGADVLLRLCKPDRQGNAASVLLPSEKSALFAPLSGKEGVHTSAAEAIAALEPTTDSSPGPIRVTVRPANSQTGNGVVGMFPSPEANGQAPCHMDNNAALD